MVSYCVIAPTNRTMASPAAKAPSSSAASGWWKRCTVWAADELFERLLGLRNDVGLLSEEYDMQAERLVGNIPQALSHLALVNLPGRAPALFAPTWDGLRRAWARCAQRRPQ